MGSVSRSVDDSRDGAPGAARIERVRMHDRGSRPKGSRLYTPAWTDVASGNRTPTSKEGALGLASEGRDGRVAVYPASVPRAPTTTRSALRLFGSTRFTPTDHGLTG